MEANLYYNKKKPKRGKSLVAFDQLAVVPMARDRQE